MAAVGMTAAAVVKNKQAREAQVAVEEEEDVDEDNAIAEDTPAMPQQRGSDSEEERPAWPLWKLVILALPQFGVQVLWCFIGPNAAPYMMHLGVGHALATLNNIAGPTTGFFVGPLVGAWSDANTSRFGRRRPVIVCGFISTCIAGLLFSASEHLFSDKVAKIAFAVPLYWCLDITINILQTPHRALVADLASKSQQVTMQVVFVVYMAIGNFAGYTIMQIYPVPTEHMFQLMCLMVAINFVCISIQFMVAREEPLKQSNAAGGGCCTAVTSVAGSVRGMPRLLYHLAFVQCLVWMGNTAWTYYGAQWFSNAVYGGDQHAPEGSAAKEAYEAGMAAFTLGGQLRSGLQLASALAIIALLLFARARPRLVYAPCIMVGAVVSLLAAFVVRHDGTMAIAVWTASIMPETGSFAIPFGLVATLNQRAEEEGKKVSTALQMALLNCCVTVGQEACHMGLSLIEHKLSLAEALPLIFVAAGIAYVISGSSALCLDDSSKGGAGSSSSGEESSATESDSA